MFFHMEYSNCVFKSAFTLYQKCSCKKTSSSPTVHTGRFAFVRLLINKSLWKHGITYSISFPLASCCTSTSSSALPVPLLRSKLSWKKERGQSPDFNYWEQEGVVAVGVGGLIGSIDPTRALEDRDGIK